MTFDIPFVNNYCLIAECHQGKKDKEYYSKALSNVQEVFDDSTEIATEYLINTQSFINEFILGTRMPKWKHDGIKEKVM